LTSAATPAGKNAGLPRNAVRLESLTQEAELLNGLWRQITAFQRQSIDSAGMPLFSLVNLAS
jgi:hypothetical protein